MSRYPPYIDDQAWSLLTEFERPQDFLHAAQFRAGRQREVTGPMGGGDALDPWVEFDPVCLLHGSFELNGKRIDVSRAVITTDAGIGKSTATHWLEYALGSAGPGLLAFRLTVRDLCSSSGLLGSRLAGRTLIDDFLNDAFLSVLAEKFADLTSGSGSSCTPAEARQAVDLQRRRGRLAVIIDELDQPGGDIARLVQLVKSPFWRLCRIILAGRPYALQRHWEELLAGRGWVFIRLEEFEEEQQRRYLGRTDDGQHDKYDLMPEDARPIFGVPRVLSYLRELPDPQLTTIHTAADVYFRVILHLIQKGMENSDQARLLGWPRDTPESVPQAQNIREARKLLSAIAYTLTCQQIRQRDPATGKVRLVSNFDRIPSIDCDCDFEEFEKQLQTRYQSKTHLGQDWQALAALNEILEHGLFEPNVEGLQEIQFRSRSLQEFLCAWYLAREATRRDAKRLWGWIYLADRPDTEEYYYIWQFLCEMPEDEQHGYRKKHWLTAIEPLYRPCFPTSRHEADGEKKIWDAKRSSEMTFRSFPRLTALCDEGYEPAKSLRDGWRDEFQQILDGQQGRQRQQAAHEFKDSFLTLPGGAFQMGSPPEKQGMPLDLRASWEAQLAQWRRGDRELQVEEYLDQYCWTGKARQRDRVRRKRDLLDAVERGVEHLESIWSLHNETPIDPQQRVNSFCMSRQPTLNRWFRLYAPQHGQGATLFADSETRISPDDGHPAVFITWFDSWAFCSWALWDQQKCSLPWEAEWEYAAKFRVKDWKQDYWWGEIFDTARCNANNSVGRTTPPSPDHANPATKAIEIDPLQLGLMDVLGNVWEWCQDVYRRAYVRYSGDDQGPASASRVLRGGSWDVDARSCRSACRPRSAPDGANHSTGFRVCRSCPPRLP